jgi:hypothetical protein
LEEEEGPTADSLGDENGAHHRESTVQDSQQLWLLQQGTLAIRKASKAPPFRLPYLFQRGPALVSETDIEKNLSTVY